MLETIATKAVEQNEAVLTDLAKKIWDCPETAFNEVKACEWTAQVLRDAGFQVEVGCAIRSSDFWANMMPCLA